ncbi:hypothetical protein V2J09_024098 [Rumex salicifolius]
MERAAKPTRFPALFLDSAAQVQRLHNPVKQSKNLIVTIPARFLLPAFPVTGFRHLGFRFRPQDIAKAADLYVSGGFLRVGSSVSGVGVRRLDVTVAVKVHFAVVVGGVGLLGVHLEEAIQN